MNSCCSPFSGELLRDAFINPQADKRILFTSTTIQRQREKGQGEALMWSLPACPTLHYPSGENIRASGLGFVRSKVGNHFNWNDLHCSGSVGSRGASSEALRETRMWDTTDPDSLDWTGSHKWSWRPGQQIPHPQQGAKKLER